MYFAAFGSSPEQMLKRGLKDAMPFFVSCSHIKVHPYFSPPEAAGGN